MPIMLRRVRVFVLALGIAGCEDASVVVTSEDGSALFRYSCAEPVAQARTTSDRALIREYAILVVRDANFHFRMDAIADVMAYYEDGNAGALESAVVSYLCAFGDDVRARAAPRFPERGSVAEDFTLPILRAAEPDVPATGPEEFRLSKHLGTTVVIYFWAPWCIPCWGTHDELSTMSRENPDLRVIIVGLIYRDSPERALRWMEDRGGMAFLNLVDDREVLGRSYRVLGIPKTVVIGPDGRIAANSVGAWSVAELMEFALSLDQ